MLHLANWTVGWRNCMKFLAMAVLLLPDAAHANQLCIAEQSVNLVPTDRALCAKLHEMVSRPGDFPLNVYQEHANRFFANYCHRDEAAGWVRDKTVRDTGPYVARLVDGKWQGNSHGTHAPVLIWYSPDFIAWLKTARPAGGTPVYNPPPVPDGAIMVKEMYPAPAARCAGADPLKLLPTSGAAIMVRDSRAARDGWYWGSYSWTGIAPSWPALPGNGLLNQGGFGQYCVNCHASAADNQTFASLSNIHNEPGEPVTFLSMDFALPPVAPKSHHEIVTFPGNIAPRLGEPLYRYDASFLSVYGAGTKAPPDWDHVAKFPSATYDNVWVKGGKDAPTTANQYVTSDQCVGCHDAGSTGLQFDMTEPDPASNLLINLSPYGTWRSSPMGLAGRDPIFFAQLASETQTFHKDAAADVQDICLGCHGIMGQRQFTLDNRVASGKCGKFLRATVDAVPYPPGNPAAAHANYGALARDGISCTSCHHAVFKDAAIDKVKAEAQNACVLERQDTLNPHATGFARTFTGSYFVGSPKELGAPFKDPKVKPMENSLGITPKHDDAFKRSDLCGSCHTVHLPVLHDGKQLGTTFEQTTYPEWAFSAFRTGWTVNHQLPFGAGSKAQSCQGCHMKSRAPDGTPFKSKIASIQEHTNFPEVENGLGPRDIDLEERNGFARHTLVGLNVFLIKMAQQFPDVLGIRTQDPMLVDKGQPGLQRTEQKMIDNATGGTASITVNHATLDGSSLNAKIDITSHTGHKFPSGVGFRRAFVEFTVSDDRGNELWSSGKTNGAGVILNPDDVVAGKQQPIAGELWWKDDCSGRIAPQKLLHQPHFQKITRQHQVQIYQELVTSPAPVVNPQCGEEATPGGGFTTSFLSICGHVKDNRILPGGFLPLKDRIAIAQALGSTAELAVDAGPYATGDDPDYDSGGGDSFVYEIDTSKFPSRPASVTATLYYQAIPPFYLQDRFCTAKGSDRDRLYMLAGHLNLKGTEAQSWKLNMVSSGAVAVTP